MLTNIESETDKSVKLAFKVSKDDFEKKLYTVYLETKDNYPVAGMETGKIPKFMIEKQYGETVFYNDTINKLIDEEFENMKDSYNAKKLNRKNVEKIEIIQIGKDKDLIFEILVNY